MTLNRPLIIVLLPFVLAACEQLGMDDPAKAAAMREAEGRAVGSGCRHTGKSLEECYETYRRESKAAVFSGWREMDGYMRENQIQTMGAGVAEAPMEKAKTEEKARPEEKAEPAKKSAEGANGAKEKSVTPAKKTISLSNNARLT